MALCIYDEIALCAQPAATYILFLLAKNPNHQNNKAIISHLQQSVQRFIKVSIKFRNCSQFIV